MDLRWTAFAAICHEEFHRCAFPAELVAACGGHEDIAWATYFHLRGDALAWLSREVPALDGDTPESLLGADQADAVRHCLWSMPC
ncbi:DUF2384 domain-containing protein [Lysobacter psychrotolerans]|uniref:DUF2384 domain-containing protein n=1 Tax=Montanilutibacter psychrotolerans TaxID=1327343 RepID=A0A3M8T662_9GAMM|nr:DUF2384 domain-containing protein [Lysobacter psychrotolerans]